MSGRPLLDDSFTRATYQGEGDEGDEIELTDMQTVWAKRFPEGESLAVKEERKLFARFAPTFDTYRDASTTDVSPQDLAALTKAYEEMIVRAEKMRTDMEARGEKVDLDKIKTAIFGHIPPNMVPPQYVAELQDWRMTRDAFTERAVKKMTPTPSTGADKAKTGTEAVSKIAEYSGKGLDVADAVMKVFPSEKGTEITKTIKEILGYIGQAADSAGTAIEGAQTASTTPESPVARKMKDEKVLSCLQKLGSAGVDVVAEFLPFLGTIKNGVECIAAIKETYERVKLRSATGELEDQAAVNTTSQLSKAFGQSAGRETRLAAQGAVDAVDKGLGTAAGVLKDTGIGAKAGLALNVVQKAAKISSMLVFFAVDESKAQAAVAMLDRARAGDVVAQQEVFREHGHYAKMLIAIWAKRQDPLAEKYLIDRGLTPSDIGHQATDIDILFDYAVEKSQEVDEPKTFMQKMKEKFETAKGVADKIATGGAKLLTWIGLLKTKPATPLPTIDRLPTAPEIDRMWEDVARMKAELGEAIQDDIDPAAVRAMNALTARLGDLLALFNDLDNAMGEEASRLEALAKTQPTADAAKSTAQAVELRKKAEEWSALGSAVKKGANSTGG